MNYEKTLAGLCALPGPSGFEGQAARAALELLRPLVDEAFLDRMGSVVGVLRCGREGAKKVLLDAHLDEIGFLITGHEEGFLRFAPLGGVDPRMLPDRELTILTQPPVVGVVSCLPPHIQSREDMDQSVAIQDLYLDVGLDQETARARIPVALRRSTGRAAPPWGTSCCAARRWTTGPALPFCWMHWSGCGTGSWT